MFSKNKYILLYIFLHTAELHAASRAGYEYVPDADAWLRMHIVPATWQDARLRCHLEGGALASPTTSAMATAMTAMMAAYKATMRYAFIGVNALISKGDFVSMDGVPMANLTLRWRDGEPNNANNNEDCVVMSGTGELVDVSCTGVYFYFCRKESNKMVLDKCGTTATGYRWEPRTGSCYKLHQVGRTWHRSAMACQAEGGHLVVINSNTEHEVLKAMVQKTAETYVGFWDWQEHGEWLTVFGETLSEAGFGGWAKGEPNNLNGVEFCGALKIDGRLNDITCNKLIPFICEITPK